MREYVKPKLDVKAYAQFENVFTACNKNPGSANCVFCHPGNPGKDSNPCPKCNTGPSNHSAKPDSVLGS